MTPALQKEPSRGRLFKLFTDLGPYFRKQHSAEKSFFFDCLEICIDDTKEPEEREFYGWWIVLTQDENGYSYQRFDGRYNLQGDWQSEMLSEHNQLQTDQSFAIFIQRLTALLEIETGLTLQAQQAVLAEV